MDILLDSNIYRSDLSLTSAEVGVIQDYLGTTNSKIILPKIVLDEIKQLHRVELEKRTATLNNAVDQLNKIVSAKQGVRVAVNFDAETDSYEEHVLTTLKINKDDIIPYEGSYMEEIAQRAIKKQKPCGEKGQGFRDAIIWLTLLDYAKMTDGKSAILISENTSDFANKENNGLHEALITDCESHGVSIIYFKSLREFIAQHSQTIAFITNDWLNKNIDWLTFNDEMFKMLNTREEFFKDFVLSHRPQLEYLRCEVMRFKDHGVRYFFVYPKSDGTMVVNAHVRLTILLRNEYLSNDPFDAVDRATDYNTALGEGILTLTIREQEIVAYSIAPQFMLFDLQQYGIEMT